jgi:hypothetical protein
MVGMIVLQILVHVQQRHRRGRCDERRGDSECEEATHGGECTTADLVGSGTGVRNSKSARSSFSSPLAGFVARMNALMMRPPMRNRFLTKPVYQIVRHGFVKADT